MTVQDIVGRYAILGNNQDEQGTEYTGILTLTLDAHQKIIAEWTIHEDQQQFGTGFLKTIYWLSILGIPVKTQKSIKELWFINSLTKKHLKEKGYPVLKEVADFWVSRVTKNNDGSYSINNVVGANEFAPNVNDNAFTNGAAKTALQYATKAAKELGISPNSKWEEVATHLKILKFPDGTTKEHAEYNGDRIKQADVNLLSYPLNIVSDKETILKDLKYYEPKLAKEGPAMGKSIFSILYARQGDVDNAYRLFKESYVPNQQAPFGALSEVATSNFSYFATGAGGMLQSVLFGFGGLEFTDEGIIQKNPILPKQWKSLTIKGVGVNNKTYKIDR